MTCTWTDPAEFKRQPWKNGQGETLELVRVPDPENSDKFLLRLSIAKIETSGPFSIFKDIDRQLILLNGDELSLKRENGEITLLKKLHCISFAGEETIYSDVKEPCRDFNVMVKRGWKKASVKILQIPKRGLLKLPANSYLYQANGSLKFQDVVRPAETLWTISRDFEIESFTDSISILVILT